MRISSSEDSSIREIICHLSLSDNYFFIRKYLSEDSSIRKFICPIITYFIRIFIHPNKYFIRNNLRVLSKRQSDDLAGGKTGNVEHKSNAQLRLIQSKSNNWLTIGFLLPKQSLLYSPHKLDQLFPTNILLRRRWT